MDRVDDILGQWRQERPDLDTGPMGIIGRVLRLAKHLQRDMERTLERHGLTFASFDVLATLRRSGPPYRLSPGDLLATMIVSSGTMTNRIDQLEKAGLVQRQANPDDGRSVLIALTDAGFGVVERALADHVATQARLTALLTGEEQERVRALLSRWLSQLEDRP